LPHPAKASTPAKCGIALLTAQEVTLSTPGESWEATFVDPATGKTLQTRSLTPTQGQLHLPFPPFAGSIALKLTLRK
jgi:hypothetical protein